MDISLLLVWVPVLCGLGMVSGFMAGLLGIGGGIILVPGLFYSLTALGFSSDYTMHMAVGTSLAVIVPTGISSVRAHWRRGAVRVDLVRRIGVGIIAGVVAGTLIAGMASGSVLNLVFAVSLIALSLVMLADPARYAVACHVPGQPWSGMMGAVIGLLSTLMGIGGATISVPYMTLCRVPIHNAIATASALGLIIAVPAAAGFAVIGLAHTGALPPFSVGFVNVLAFALIVPASVLSAPLGAAAAHRMAVKPLRRIFAGFMMVVALQMLYEVLYG